MSRIKRSSLKSIAYLMEKFPLVAILGARQVGKTTLLKELRPKTPFFDLERSEDFARIERGPDFFLQQFEGCLVIDEAQMMPALFNALRVRIDQRRDQMGQFLISGSSSPELLSHITESLAGRVAIFELPPFGLHESWERPPSALPLKLLEKKLELPQSPTFSKEQIEESFLYGGHPDAFLNRMDKKFFMNWMENYRLTYLRRDIRSLFPSLNLSAYQKFLTMLAESGGQLLNYSEYARSLDVSQPTVKSYFQIADGSFFWRTLPSYEKNVKKRVSKMPKGHIVDSGINHFLLQLTDRERLYSSRRVGWLWQSFVTDQLLRMFKDHLIPVKGFHYRTHNGDEIDLIIQGPFDPLPVEIKLGTSISTKQLKVLEKFMDEHNLPWGLVINNARKACWLKDRIAQIPLEWWG
ncbi:MAG: AAA family ATPase [Bacteriovoracales bacterium]|nr:AAA family ATPase [Bacteriovoracales bacterium]